MPNLYEPYRVLSWLQTTLAPLASGGAHHGVATVDIQPPFIVYALQSGLDASVIGGIRLWNDGVYQIKVVGPATISATLGTIADAVDNALQRQNAINVGTDGTMLYCVREQTLILPENVVNGGEWLNIIGIYRIYLQAR